MFRLKLDRGRAAFLMLAPALLATALIQVPDPICGGTGYLSSTPGMENIRVTDVRSAQLLYSKDLNVCAGLYPMYLYSVTLSVVNDGDEDIKGYVRLTLIDLRESAVEDTQYVAIEVPAKEGAELSYRVWFNSNQDFRLVSTEVRAEAVVEDTECPVCRGTGKISLNTLPLLNFLKEKLIVSAEQQIQYVPPPVPFHSDI